MQTHITTTPFGRRRMTLGLMASQVAAKSMPQGARVEKWKTFHAIKYKPIIIFYALQVIYIFSTIVSAEERQYPTPANDFAECLKVSV